MVIQRTLFWFCLLLAGILQGGEPPAESSGHKPPAPDPELSEEERAPRSSTSVDSDLNWLEEYRRLGVQQARLSREDALRLQRILQRLRTQQDQTQQSNEEKRACELLKRALQMRLIKRPDSRHAREALAMFHLFLNEPDKALAHLRKLGPASTQDVAHRLLTAYLLLRLGEYEPGADLVKQTEQLLQRHLPLRMSRPVFCERIRGFRQYTPRAEAPLKPGEDVLLYLEVAGVTFRRGQDGYAFSLHFGLTFKDEFMAERAAIPSFGTFAHTYPEPIQEMDLKLAVRIPNNLSAGRYHLFVHCHDAFSGKDATTDLAFEVGEPATAAPPPAATPDKQPGDPAAAPTNPPDPGIILELDRERRRDQRRHLNDAP